MKQTDTSIRLILLTLLFAMTLTAQSVKADDATSILKAASERIKKAPSVTATLTITTDGRPVTGHLTLSGNRFALTTPHGSTWFDGKTLWSHSVSTREVNISEPEVAELAEINPLVMIDTSLSGYKTRLVKSSPDKVIEMIPANPRGADITKAVVTISGTTGWPVSIILTVNNRPVKVDFEKVTTGKQLTSKEFTFNPAMFPNATINDLR
ncbi:MAG: hypothetical protein K2J42_09010 [Muribaculaceae bacterium]|nr:hypothetical protein [Muribaculaceae bacterium]